MSPGNGPVDVDARARAPRPRPAPARDRLLVSHQAMLAGVRVQRRPARGGAPACRTRGSSRAVSAMMRVEELARQRRAARRASGTWTVASTTFSGADQNIIATRDCRSGGRADRCGPSTAARPGQTLPCSPARSRCASTSPRWASPTPRRRSRRRPHGRRSADSTGPSARSEARGRADERSARTPRAHAGRPPPCRGDLRTDAGRIADRDGDARASRGFD